MPSSENYVQPARLVDADAPLSPSSLYLVHLLSCALRAQAPAELPNGASWDGVFKLATSNSVATTCAFAVAMASGAGAEERKRWQAEVDRNLMRHVVFDMERETLFAAMDEAGLAHLPLKGVVTSREYPRPEMRWMCDNDILFGHVDGVAGDAACVGDNEATAGGAACGGTAGDGEGHGADHATAVADAQATHGSEASVCATHGAQAADPTIAAATDEDARGLRSIMEADGFKTAHFGAGNHDAYEKAPFLNFEMHRGLMNPEVSWWRYYENPWQRARKDTDAPGLSYVFGHEDAYLFHVAHMFKHFSNSGCGVRGIADEWVLLQAWGPSMDRAYLDDELAKLGMLEFERALARTATSVIGKDACGRTLAGDAGALDADDTAMLAYMLGSGTYGTVANNVAIKLAQQAGEHGQRGLRARYLLSRAFPPLEKLRQYYTVLNRAPWLLPGVYAYRFLVKPFTRTKRLRAELDAVAKSAKKGR